mgnify:FL=1
MKKFTLILLLVAFLFPGISEAQRWKRMRYELNGGLGASNFLGELGGSDQIGTNLMKDLDFAMTRYVLSGGLRYKLTKRLSAKGSIQIGMLRGDDAQTQEFSRNYRNLSFRSPLYEVAVQFEASITKEQVGTRYRLRGVKGRSWLPVNIYPFIGIAGFYMNPKAKYNGVWHALQPLATEGQGQLPTRPKYSRFQVAVPIGIGFKYGFTRRWSISLEYGLRKTFTDYIDDVSTTYVNEEYLVAGASDAEMAIALADRADGGLGQAGSSPNKTAPGEQRGNPKKDDSYMFAIVSLNYKFRKLTKQGRGTPKL